MKYEVAALTLLVTLGLTVRVAAQSRNSSQDFFEQGWDQLEEEIQILQGEEFDLEELLSGSQELPQQQESEPSLEVCPDRADEFNQQPNLEENPCQKPQEQED